MFLTDTHSHNNAYLFVLVRGGGGRWQAKDHCTVLKVSLEIVGKKVASEEGSPEECVWFDT